MSLDLPRQGPDPQPIPELTETQRLEARIRNETLFDWVLLDDMSVDHGYARPWSRALHNRIRGTWTPKAVGAIYLSLRNDGRYFILDGQHRVSVARETGMTSLPCQVFLYLTYEGEAELYAIFGRVKTQSPGDRFRARVEMGDPVAREILGIVRSHDLEIAYKAQSEPGKIRAVASLERIYLDHGPETLDAVIGLTKRVWTHEPHAYAGWVLDGLAAFWIRNASLLTDHVPPKRRGMTLEQKRFDRLLKRLVDAGIAALNNRAMLIKQALSSISGLRGSWGHAVLEIYNAGLPKNSKLRLPEWSENFVSERGRARWRDAQRRAASERRQQRRTTGPNNEAVT